MNDRIGAWDSFLQEFLVAQVALDLRQVGVSVRITEDVGGRRDTIIIPAPGLEDFKKLLEEMVKASAEIPPKA